MPKGAIAVAVVGALVAGIGGSASAATLVWDPQSKLAPSDGNGTSNSGTPWYNGSVDVTYSGTNAMQFGTSNASYQASSAISIQNNALTTTITFQNSDPSTFTFAVPGTWQVNSGTSSAGIVIGSGLGAVTFNSNAIQFVSTTAATISNSSSNAVTFSAGIKANTQANSTLYIKGTGDTTVNGAITANNTGVKLDKSGAGTLTLSGNNTYNGSTTINDGTVASKSVSTTTIAGTVSTAATGSPKIAAGGVGTIGELDLSSTLGLTNNSTLAFDINGTTSDLLKITGALSVAGTPTITLTTTGTLSGDYTLATYASSGLTNSNFSLPSAPSGYGWTVSDTSIILTAVPEPASLGLLLIGSVFGLKRRSRRQTI